MTIGDAPGLELSRSAPWDLTPALVGLVASLVVASRLSGLVVNPEPWLDEAMLMMNFMVVDWPSTLKPLPLFEQSAPLGYVLMGKAASVLGAGGAAIAMRCLAAAASLGTGFLFFRLLRRVMPSGWAAVATCALMMNGALTFHSIEIKHYGLEAFGNVAIMGCAVHAARRGADLRSLALLTAVGVAALLCSFTAVLAVAGFGGALFVDRAAQSSPNRLALLRVGIAGAVLAGVWALVYFGYSRASVGLLMSRHADRYALGVLPFPPLDDSARQRWAGLAGLLENGYLRPLPWRLATLGFVGLTGLGAVSLFVRGGRDGRLLATGSALFVAAMLTASIAGVFTPYSERHFVFAAPIMVLLFGNGVMALVTWASRFVPAGLRNGAVTGSMLVLILLFGAPGMVRAAQPEREPLGGAVERARRDGAWPGDTWVDYLAQPAIDLAAYPVVPRYLGRTPHGSVPGGWLRPVRADYPAQAARFARELSERPRVYLLYSHVSRSPRGRTHLAELEMMIAAAERVGAACARIEVAYGSRGETGLYRCERRAADAGAADRFHGRGPGAPG